MNVAPEHSDSEPHAVVAGFAEQVPALPARLHARHGPEQLVLQHTLSAHTPEVHSLESVQVVPLVFLVWQLPVAQNAPDTQSPSEEHEVMHAPDLQSAAPQVGCPARGAPLIALQLPSAPTTSQA